VLWIWLDYEKNDYIVNFRMKTLKVIGRKEVVFKKFVTEINDIRVKKVVVNDVEKEFSLYEGMLNINEDIIFKEKDVTTISIYLQDQ
jgi:hypothetical protein